MNADASVPEEWDTIVIGGGPAGLSCALWLARYRRNVCIFDTGEPRNRPAWAVHGFPGLPDPPPLELRARIRLQAVDAGAHYRIGAVTRVTGSKEQFEVILDHGEQVRSRRVVLAYGLRDFLPEVPGIDAFYGHSVYHCPDCDGPSVTNQRVGVIGHDRHAAALALSLLTWAGSVCILANGFPANFTPRASATLEQQGIRVLPGTIGKLVGTAGCLQEVIFKNDGGTDGGTDGATGMDAIFFHLGTMPHSPFATDLGCRMDEDGYIEVDSGQQTSAPGVYAAGDIAGHPHLAVTAAAEGVRAALAIHRSLTPDSFFVSS